MVGLRSSEGSGPPVCVDWHQKDHRCERPCGHIQTGIRKSQMEKTQKLIPYEEEGGEVASELPVAPVPALEAAGEVGRGQPGGE